MLKRKVAERDLTGLFAHYFRNNMKDTAIAEYNVDCEYNRDGYGMKKIDGTLVYPDFILHKRGTNESNLLIIEFKTWWNSDNREDIEKLKAMMSEWYRYQYQYGYSIILNQERDSVTVTCVEH